MYLALAARVELTHALPQRPCDCRCHFRFSRHRVLGFVLTSTNSDGRSAGLVSLRSLNYFALRHQAFA